MPHSSRITRVAGCWANGSNSVRDGIILRLVLLAASDALFAWDEP
jgi:hypothetical protein